MKRLIILTICLFLIGCVTSKQAHVQRMESWEGKNIQNLIDSPWGYPDSQMVAPNGNTVHIYSKGGQSVGTTQVYNWSKKEWAPQSHVYNYECVTYFETDKNNKIINVRWKGASCPNLR